MDSRAYESTTDPAQSMVVDLRCDLCGVQVGTVQRAARHFAERHTKVSILYRCDRCQKVSSNHHSVSCHILKCPGVQPATDTVGRSHLCDSCEACFPTQRGLSTHRRIVHGKIPEYRMAGVRAPAEREAVKRRRADEEGANEGIEDFVIEHRNGREPGSVSRLCGYKRQKGNDCSLDKRTEGQESEPVLRVPVTGLLEAYRGLAAEMIDAARTSKDQHISVLKLWLEDAAEWPARLEAAARSVLRMLGGVEEKDWRKHLTSRKSLRVRVTGTGGSRRARARTAAFSRCQQLFRNDPARLAQEVLDGSSPAVCPIPLTVVEEAYRRKWEVPGLFDGLRRFLIEGDADNGPFESALTATEVLESLRAMSSDSTPGPDGIKKQSLLEWDPECETVTRMFNVWMFTGVVPVCFKRCRTVLEF
ncbi:uncharacterized protein LOC125795236 [Astyanax mexicanus]|uniref:uncharacterized protein LOC125795236 n=1 Tax=Astyanax mexicanus TaxID=7994 RepID=UPI0020CAE691|nr:uncharacterized protein LOC125795236 [Astyanax mexicanus]